MAPRPGEALNDLVAILERVVANNDDVKVESRKKLRDRDTGRLREHDVVITWGQQHHTIVTAIECRDRGRPVGVPDVEAFADKCEHTGIHHRVIVSASGFRESARVKALTRGISLLELRQVEAFDWMGMKFFVGYERTFSPVDAHVFFLNEKPEADFTLFDCNGTEVNGEMLAATFIKNVPACERADQGVGTLTNVQMRMNTIGWIARNASGGEFRVHYINAYGSYTVVKRMHPVTLHSYSGGGKDYEIATADASIGSVRGKMIMVKDDAQIRVVWNAQDSDQSMGQQEAPSDERSR